MLQPQSDEEIRPVVEALRRLDPLLSVRWNPQAIMTAKGSYDAFGHRIDPTYDGRWEVIRFQTASTLHPERGYTVICTVSAPREQDGVTYLTHNGPYAPIGEWLVTFMQSADAANVRHFETLRKKLWAQHERAEADLDAIDEGEAEDALLRHKFAVMGQNYMGRGADFTPNP